jgi:hypothetical protein
MIPTWLGWGWVGGHDPRPWSRRRRPRGSRISRASVRSSRSRSAALRRRFSFDEASSGRSASARSCLHCDHWPATRITCLSSVAAGATCSASPRSTSRTCVRSGVRRVPGRILGRPMGPDPRPTRRPSLAARRRDDRRVERPDLCALPRHLRLSHRVDPDRQPADRPLQNLCWLDDSTPWVAVVANEARIYGIWERGRCEFVRAPCI